MPGDELTEAEQRQLEEMKELGPDELGAMLFGNFDPARLLMRDVRAYHEAGHAVLAVRLLGIDPPPIVRVGIGADTSPEQDRAAVFANLEATGNIGEDVSTEIESPALADLSIADRTVLYVAGLYAGRTFDWMRWKGELLPRRAWEEAVDENRLPQSSEAFDDLSKVREWARAAEVRFDEVVAQAFGRLTAEHDTLWPVIEALAERLLATESGTLDWMILPTSLRGSVEYAAVGLRFTAVKN